MPRFSIRNKLFIAFSLLVLIALSTSFFLVYRNTKETLSAAFQSELQNTTAIITNLVQGVAATSIENHLKSIAETQLEMISSLYAEQQSGRFSEKEAKALAAEILLRQTIGTSGYLYCVDSQGNVTVHRDKQVQGSNALSFQFVRDQVRLKTGYLEYRWKNSAETEERDKALYMAYFEPWDWIVSASAYKNEFTHLVDLSNIHKTLAKVKFGASGYPYIINGAGDYIYHPNLEGNAFRIGLPEEFINTVENILALKEGTIYYLWQNPPEPAPREKISIINYLENYDWIVGTSAYLDELYQPLERIKQIFLLIFVLYGGVILLASYGLSSLITRPLLSLIAHFKDQQPSTMQPLTGRFRRDEAGQLANYLNQFIHKLNEHHQALTAEIAERKRSEKALRESEQTFHTLFDHSFQFIALLDHAGRVRKINQTALSFRQLTDTEVLGKYFWETPWWQHSTKLVAQLNAAYDKAKKGQVARFEAHSTQVREIFLDVSLKPVLDDTRQVIYIVAEARDVTEVRRAGQELQQAQKMESVGTLAGGIAHDFNNILGGILGTLSLLKLKRDKGLPLSEEALFKHLDTVASTAQRAKQIVNQLLTLSRKHELEFAPVDLRQIMEHVCQIARNSFDKSIQIESQLDESIPVQADASSLEQVFLNICINAAHAMTIMRPQKESWGGTLQILQSRVCHDGKTGPVAGEYWHICITDSGVGMDSETLERIFTPFFSTKDKNSGSGLGLSMVYNIVQQHQGFLDVQSTPGNGTRFSVYLPVCQQPLVRNNNSYEDVIVHGTGLILIIDDEEIVRNTAREILTECGYDTLTAENGQAGVELFRQHHPRIQAVLLDLVMPVMSGRDAYHALKRIDPEAKILLSSGFRQDERVEEILQAGAAGFIQKPYSLYKLSSAIKRLT